MAQRDSDIWDLASSVGATATMVAAARALASRDSEPLIGDPFAAPLVRAVGLDFFIRLLDGGIPGRDIRAPYPFRGTPCRRENCLTNTTRPISYVFSGQKAEQGLQLETASMAVRTRFFDDFVVDAGRAGLQQAVILAAGLDSRPYRLPWPPDTVVYEVDQPKVIKFKSAALSALGAAPTAHRRTVGIDLRDDWPAALRRNGFDDTRPASWSAEGLLMYLPPEAQDRLFDNITALSAPGSRLATEYHPESGPTWAERGRATNQRWANLGCDIDLSGLFYEGVRSNVVDYLTDRGWDVTTRPRREMFADYGLTFADDDETAPARNVVAVTATRRG